METLPATPPRHLRIPLHSFFARRFRPRRMRAFVERFCVTNETRILDVGGTQHNWLMVDVKPRIVVLNRVEPNFAVPDHIEWRIGDALNLPFPDNSFDIAFSNSVIEHVGDWEAQVRFAREIRRVARSYYVQTPNFWFPIEPHWLTPGIHYVRPSVRRRIARWTVWGLLRQPTPAEIEAKSTSIRLLRRSELRVLFPDAEITAERFLGLAKSFMACRHVPTRS